MALLCIDSFSFYDHNTIQLNGGLFENWDAANPASEVIIDADYGRNGTSGLQLITGSYTSGMHGSVTKYLDSVHETLIVGAAVRIDSISTSTSSESHFNRDRIIFAIMDGSKAQVALCVTPSMRLRLRRRGLTGPEIARSNFILHEDVYYYMELKVLISNTAGTYDVRIDGVSRLSGVGNTRFTNNNYANGVRLGDKADTSDSYAGRHIKFDDFYIASIEGASPTDFIGDVTIEGLVPTNDRSGNQWSPSSGTIHYSLIDDETPNTTDYLRAGTVGYVDTFQFSSVTIPSGDVIAVSPNIYARKTTAGVATIVPVMSRQGTVTAAIDEHYLTQEYRYHEGEIWTTRPSDNSTWSLNFTNDTYFGVKRSG